MLCVLIACFVINLLVGKKLYKTYSNPITFFIGVFFAAFVLLYSVDFISKSLINDTIWVMFYVSFISFYIGIILNRMVPFKIRTNRISNYTTNNEKDRYRREIWILTIISVIATVMYWLQAIRVHGVHGLISSLLTSQESDNLGGLPVVVLYIKMITLFLSPYVMNYVIEYKERKSIYIAIIIFTFFANIAYTRNVIFYIALLDLFVFIYSHIRINSKLSFKWILYVFIAVIAFRFFSYTQTLFNKQFEVQGTFLGKNINGPIVTVISYFTGPIVSTGIYYNQIHDVPFLGYTLRNILSFLNAFGFTNIDTDIYMPTTWVYIPFKFNTTTIQLYIFKEGGWVWLLLFFACVGIIVDKLFYGYRKTKNRFSLMLLSLLSLLLVTSIRSYIFTRLDMFIYCIVLLVLYISRFFVINRRNRRKTIESTNYN